MKAHLEKAFGVRVETLELAVQNEEEIIVFRKWAEGR